MFDSSPTQEMIGLPDTDVLSRVPSDVNGFDPQTQILRMCETWWLQQRPDREQVILQAITVLFIRSLLPNASFAGMPLWAVS